MSEVPAIRINITNIASSSGAARLQISSGTLPYQSLIVDCELTAAQNAAMQVALAAAAGTSTNFDFAPGPAAIQGVASSI